MTPSSEEEIVALVTACAKDGRKIRVRGAGKSAPTVIATDHIALSMEHFSTITAIDSEKHTVTVGSGMLIDDLCARLWDVGFTVYGIGTVSGQTVGGLIATGTHSQGLEVGKFATSVTRIRMIDGRGQTHVFSKKDNCDIFDALPISLGSLGIFTEVDLSILPSYNVKQSVQVMNYHKHSDWPLDIATSTCSMIRMRPELGLAIALTLEATAPDPSVENDSLRSYEGHFRYVPSTHPDLKAIGKKKWELRLRNLPHRLCKRLSAPQPPMTVSNSGYAIPIGNAPRAMELLDRFIMNNYPRLKGTYMFRAAKADDLWLSQSFAMDVCHVGCYMKSAYDTERYQKEAESILIGLDARPHWGKPFSLDKYHLGFLFPKWEQFKALRREMDPDDVFVNGWTSALWLK